MLDESTTMAFPHLPVKPNGGQEIYCYMEDVGSVTLG